MTWFPETRAALKALRWNMRALWCEWLMLAAVRMCPKGYVPVHFEMILERDRAA